MKNIKACHENTYPTTIGERMTLMTVLVSGGCGPGDVAAYAAIVDMGVGGRGQDAYQRNRESNQQWVADHGNKLTKQEAFVLFPSVAETGYRR